MGNILDLFQNQEFQTCTNQQNKRSITYVRTFTNSTVAVSSFKGLLCPISNFLVNVLLTLMANYELEQVDLRT